MNIPSPSAPTLAQLRLFDGLGSYQKNGVVVFVSDGFHQAPNFIKR
jgi:hypothetical protein